MAQAQRLGKSIRNGMMAKLNLEGHLRNSLHEKRFLCKGKQLTKPMIMKPNEKGRYKAGRGGS
jgi:hypothetical protein